MIAALDVQYAGQRAFAAGVAFADWRDAAPAAEFVVDLATQADYEPGAFYKRELPPLLHLLTEWSDQKSIEPETLLVDGYVWLGLEEVGPKPGLGARLFDALANRCAVIGVAKNAFRGAAQEGPHRALELCRGASAAPLFVTAAGTPVEAAAAAVAAMHGPHRLPTLIKRADALARNRARRP